MDVTRNRGTATLGVAVAGVGVACATAVLVNVPAAAVVLAAMCAVLAVLRGTATHEPATFRARSKPFDVTALVVAAAALAVLAPAGNLA